MGLISHQQGQRLFGRRATNSGSRPNDLSEVIRAIATSVGWSGALRGGCRQRPGACRAPPLSQRPAESGSDKSDKWPAAVFHQLTHQSLLAISGQKRLGSAIFAKRTRCLQGQSRFLNFNEVLTQWLSSLFERPSGTFLRLFMWALGARA